MSARHMRFTISSMPVPLSACFVNVGKNGRADSPRYKTFKKSVDAELVRNFLDNLGTPYRATFDWDVAVQYVVKRPDKRTRDLDNALKSMNDTLVRNHILKDDSQIIDLRIRWAAPGEKFEGSVLVSITDTLATEVAA